MRTLLEPLKRCAEDHTFDSGDPDNPAVLDQLYRAYAESHETDLPEIKDGFKELDTYGSVCWMTTMQFGTFAATFVQLTNTRPSCRITSVRALSWFPAISVNCLFSGPGGISAGMV